LAPELTIKWIRAPKSRKGLKAAAARINEKKELLIYYI
jgi:hypothetical protein